MLYFMVLPLITLSLKKVEFRLSRNYGQLVYDFSGNSQHSSNGLSTTTTQYDGLFTDRGIYLNSTACTLPLSTNSAFKVPNPGTVIVWAMTSATTGRFIHQYIDSSNAIYYRKGSLSTLEIWHHFSNSNATIVSGPANSFLSSNYNVDTWVMISIIFSGRYIKIYQNLSLMINLDYLSTYAPNYRMVLGSCSPSFLGTESFIYYFAVFDSDSIQSTYFGSTPSSNCLIGAGTCTTCSYSVYLDYLNEYGCISTCNSPDTDAYGQACQQGSTCRENIQLNCLCPSFSCYFTSASLIQCINNSTGELTQTASTCTALGQGCCLSQCHSCSTETSCLSCIFSNAFVDTDGLCSCKDGYYGTRPLTSSASCIACNSLCSKCASASACTECIAQNSSPFASGCACNTGYYSTGPLTTSDACHKCNDDCLSCLNSTTCTACIAQNSFISINGCICQDGYWSIGTLNSAHSCIKCNGDCLKCTNSITCTSCISQNSLVSSSGCVCSDGYWGSGVLIMTNSCLKCRDDCLKCNNSITCTECVDPNSEIGTNGCVCKDGYYGSGTITISNPCIKCNKDCLKCSNSITCTECIASNSEISEFGCKCNIGYWGNIPLASVSSCLKCNSDCLSCINNITCTECISQNTNITDFGCVCKEGYYSIGNLISFHLI